MKRSIARSVGMSLWLAAVAATHAAALGEPREDAFATRVMSYAPAPGQFVRDAGYSDPTNALGPPEGLGTSDGNDAGVVTLGGFGGSIVLGFDHMVVDHPLNPLGLDAIVFGNAFWRDGDPDRHWAECATIEISLDVNSNGLADDPWFLIPGSHLAVPNLAPSVATWDIDTADPSYPPASANWLPVGSRGRWITQAYVLPSAVFGTSVVVNPLIGGEDEGIVGYADYSPTLLLGDLDGDDGVDDPTLGPDAFYVVPDDPFNVGIDFGSGGGDAFDIAWALDPWSGERARLPGFHFIRLTTAVAAVSPVFGEKSAEIDAVADVAIDPTGDYDGDEDLDLADVAGFQRCVSIPTDEDLSCHVMAPDGGAPRLTDWERMRPRMTGPSPGGSSGLLPP